MTLQGYFNLKKSETLYGENAPPPPAYLATAFSALDRRLNQVIGFKLFKRDDDDDDEGLVVDCGGVLDAVGIKCLVGGSWQRWEKVCERRCVREFKKAREGTWRRGVERCERVSNKRYTTESQ